MKMDVVITASNYRSTYRILFAEGKYVIRTGKYLYNYQYRFAFKKALFKTILNLKGIIFSS